MPYQILVIGLQLTEYGEAQWEANKGRDGSGGGSNKDGDPVPGGKRVIKAGNVIPDHFGGKSFSGDQALAEAEAWVEGEDGQEFQKFYEIVLLGSVVSKT
jgi:hypothetical protein